MSDEEIYDLVASAEEWADRPFTSAPELAEKIGLTRQAVHHRLQNLLDEFDDLRKYNAGRDAIYWVERRVETEND